LKIVCTAKIKGNKYSLIQFANRQVINIASKNFDIYCMW